MPQTNPKYYEWTLKVRAKGALVEDGFDLSANNVRAMISMAFPYAGPNEFDVAIEDAPNPNDIAKEQGVMNERG